MIGTRFTRLVVQREIERIHFKSTSSRRYVCLCDCGNEVIAYPSNLRRGGTKSCGCLKLETTGDWSRTHGMSKSDEYKIWAGMRKRCLNPAYREYHLYGGRGITISPRWDEFANFFADMGFRPSPTHSLDRIKSDGNYEPDNCRWATDLEQSNNTSRNVCVTYQGRQYSVSQLARLTGFNHHTIFRWKHKWAFTDAQIEERLIAGQGLDGKKGSRRSSNRTNPS